MKRVLAIVLLLSFLVSLCGCGETASSTAYIAVEKIATLDPQIVSRPSDRTVVLNIYEGLFRLDENDNPIPAAAESYSISGLEYTFNLAKNLKWSDGSELTAYDFEYALRRAVLPETNAPDFSKISSIKGANEVRNGKNISNLAVKAVDKYTLKITLARSDENFLKTLTEPICMPCNEQFFLDQTGKYGRGGDNVLSNGLFYVYSWNNERIRLKKDGNYGGSRSGGTDEVYLTFPDEAEVITMLEDKDIDLSFIDATKQQTAEDKGLKTQSYFDKYVFVFINKNAALGSETLRKALSLSLHRNAIMNDLPAYIEPLSAVVQPSAMFGETSIYSAVSASAGFSYLPDEAYSMYLEFTKQNGSIKTQSIIYPEELEIDTVVSAIASSWQQNLGCVLNMSAVSTNADVLKKIGSGDYSIAICAIGAGDRNAQELLAAFRSGNIYGFSNSEYDSIIASLQNKTTAEDYIAAVSRAQSILLRDGSIIPIAAAQTVLCMTEQISSVRYSIANEYIDFASIKKN